MTTRRSVYAIGKSIHGALGNGKILTGHGDTVHKVSLGARVERDVEGNQEGSATKLASAGWGHSAFVAENGKLYVSGTWKGFRKVAYWGAFHEKFPLLARMTTRLFGSNIPDSTEPVEVEGVVDCTDVDCGLVLTAAIDGEGRLWCGGDNHIGQCGVGRETEDSVWPPERVRNTDGLAIRTVAVGLNHGLFATDTGELYGWGINTSGQLGTGSRHPYLSARRIDIGGTSKDNISSGISIQSVAAGMTHSVALTSDGAVYVWGKQLDSSEIDKVYQRPVDQLVPRRIDIPEAVVSIACGMHNTAVLTTSGRIFMMGRVGASATLPEFKLDDAGVFQSNSSESSSSPRKNAIREASERVSSVMPNLSPLPGVKPVRIRHEVDGNAFSVVGTTSMVVKPYEVRLPSDVTISTLRSGFDGPVGISSDGKAVLFEVGKSPTEAPGSDLLPEDASILDVSLGWKHSTYILK